MHVCDTEEFRRHHAVRLAALAHHAYADGRGRGALFVYPPPPGPDGTWNTTYAHELLIEMLGGSEDLLQAVRSYNPECEAVLVVKDGDTLRRMVASLELNRDPRAAG